MLVLALVYGDLEGSMCSMSASFLSSQVPACLSRFRAPFRMLTFFLWLLALEVSTLLLMGEPTCTRVGITLIWEVKTWMQCRYCFWALALETSMLLAVGVCPAEMCMRICTLIPIDAAPSRAHGWSLPSHLYRPVFWHSLSTLDGLPMSASAVKACCK